MKRLRIVITTIVVFMISCVVFTQGVSKEEYEKLKKEVEELRAQIKELKESQGWSEDFEKELKEIKSKASYSYFGESKFLVTGYGFATYSSKKDENSTFNSGFNPIFLWRINDRLLFEGELELELEGSQTKVALEYANISYILNDYVTLRAGKFLAPFGIFQEKLHPAWINKLPDKPLPFGHDGIGPTTMLGFEVRGAIALNLVKFNYSLYVANGPLLKSTDPNSVEVGMLGFKNFEDINENKTIGGRVGFLPIPELEIGFSFLTGKVGASGTPFSDVGAFLWGVDLNYVKDLEFLKGTVDVKAEYINSKVDDATYGTLTFNNKREGGYFQLAYRPSKLGDIIKNFEIVSRYSWLDNPFGPPDSHDERNWTFGLNYWLSASAVIKAAYQFGKKRHEEDGEKENTHAFLIQFSLGF